MKAKFIWVFLLLNLLWSQSAPAQEATKLCYDDADNFPWLVKNGPGLSNKLIDLASTKSGVKVEQLPYPWKRCLHNIAIGLVAGGFSASYSDERAAFAVYPTTPDGKPDYARRIKSDGYSLYRLKGTAARWDGKQFVDLTGPIGSQLGYSSSAELRKHGVSVTESGDLPDKAMKHLIVGDLQLLALMTFEGDEQLGDPNVAARVEKVASPFVEKPYFVIFNKAFYAANKSLVESFWAGLAAARDSPEFNRLLKEQIKQIPVVPVAK